MAARAFDLHANGGADGRTRQDAGRDGVALGHNRTTGRRPSLDRVHGGKPRCVVLADRVKTRTHRAHAQDRFTRPVLMTSSYRREGSPDSNDAHCRYGIEFSHGLFELCIGSLSAGWIWPAISGYVGPNHFANGFQATMIRIGRQRPSLKRCFGMVFVGVLTIAAAGSRAHAAEDSYGGFSYYFHIDRLEDRTGSLRCGCNHKL